MEVELTSIVRVQCAREGLKGGVDAGLMQSDDGRSSTCMG